MTTIAYKDGRIATDGQLTAGDVIIYIDEVKRKEHQGVYFFLCGSDNDIDKMMAAWPDKKIKGECRAAGFVVNQGNLFVCCENNGRAETWEHVKEAPYAFGSGGDYAIGAMDAGLSAEESISIAAARDVGTGGTIRVYDAKTGEQIS